LTGRRLFGLLIACFYPGLLLSIVALVRKDFPAGGKWVIVILGTAFLSDTGAYFAGRFLGKRKLAPKLSPQKTVEGAIGGIAGSLAWTVAAHFSYLSEMTLPAAVALGVFGSVAGQLGDLVESLMKRASAIKDAGAVFPGHGGMMDRIDAAVFVCVVYYGYLVLWRYP
jgi:phosphatidate cytidylyltransferase